jgi:putative phosphoribosyl transferase
MNTIIHSVAESEVEISCGAVALQGFLRRPSDPAGLVIFAHGSGSSRTSRRNDFVARELNRRNLATLLFDLLTPAEAADESPRGPRFDIPLLTSRLAAATRWAMARRDLAGLPTGYFGASTGAAAALAAAASQPAIAAVVSRGGRTDLAGDCIRRIKAPTLMIAGAEDHAVVGMNHATYEQLACLKCLMLIGGATHLFGEPGTLEQVADLAADWFRKHFDKADQPHPQASHEQPTQT